MVEKNVLDENHITRNPLYKDKDCWLVPIFNKNTGKFTRSVFAHPKGHGYFQNPSTYSKYEEHISDITSNSNNQPKKKINISEIFNLTIEPKKIRWKLFIM